MLKGWDNDDHLAALSCFRVSARAYAEGVPSSRQGATPSAELLRVCEQALQLNPANLGEKDAKAFFETHFQPMAYAAEKGFVTAYFEPEVGAARRKSKSFTYPIYARPPDLVKITDQNKPGGWPVHLEYARIADSGLVEYFDRQQIDTGALEGKGLELFWVKSVIEAFYIHVQGSARLLLDDGTTARISYAGKTGHPYTSIGKLLVKRGVMTVEKANMENIRAWLEADIDRASEVLHANRSYIFFAEVEGHNPEFGPVAAAGVQLTPGRSLAVDRNEHAYGTPVWLTTDEPLPSSSKPFNRLMIAQDTGSAIVGPQRGDIFIGSGAEAGMIAGSVRHSTGFVVFKPVPGK